MVFKLLKSMLLAVKYSLNVLVDKSVNCSRDIGARDARRTAQSPYPKINRKGAKAPRTAKGARVE